MEILFAIIPRRTIQSEGEENRSEVIHARKHDHPIQLIIPFQITSVSGSVNLGVVNFVALMPDLHLFN
jgi:hypothetical protein